MKREIILKLINVDETMLLSVGVYKIVNTINKHFYIGSSDRQFKERFKEHCRYYEQYKNQEKRNMHPKLWNAYDKYGIENFSVEIIEVMNGKTTEEILKREEYYIQTLKPEYNICQYPSCGGKPNLGRKLTDEWKAHISEKSKLYKHSKETLQKVIKNNKENAIKLTFVSKHDSNIVHNFNSWKEAQDFFKLKTSSNLITAYNKKGCWRDWNIIKLTTQKKKIKVFLEDSEIVFNSYSECDRYFDMWRGYTSELLKKQSKQLIKNKYEYELL